MINREELRLGSIVEFEDGEWIVEELTNEDLYLQKDHAAVAGSTIHVGPILYSDINPAVITEEHLLERGFEIQDSIYFNKKINSVFSLNIKISNNGCIINGINIDPRELEVISVVMVTHIKYLHLLDNLLTSLKP